LRRHDTSSSSGRARLFYMRILIATSNRNLVGGIESYLKELIPGLLYRGHQVALLYENQFDPKVESIDPPEAHLSVWRPSELGVETVLRSLGEWKPGIVYAHGLDASSLESELLSRYRQCCTPTITTRLV